MGCGNDLFTVFLRQSYKPFYHFAAEFGIEGSIDVLDCKEAWCLIGYDKCEIKKQVKEALVCAALVKDIESV